MKKKPYGLGKKWRIRGRKRSPLWQRRWTNPTQHFSGINFKKISEMVQTTGVTSTKQ